MRKLYHTSVHAQPTKFEAKRANDARAVYPLSPFAGKPSEVASSIRFYG